MKRDSEIRISLETSQKLIARFQRDFHSPAMSAKHVDMEQRCTNSNWVSVNEVASLANHHSWLLFRSRKEVYDFQLDMPSIGTGQRKNSYSNPSQILCKARKAYESSPAAISYWCGWGDAWVLCELRRIACWTRWPTRLTAFTFWASNLPMRWSKRFTLSSKVLLASGRFANLYTSFVTKPLHL